MSEIKKKIAVFVSGSGSNLQAIIDSIESGKLNCEIAFVIADRPCYALERAEKHNIRSVMLDRKLFGEKLSDEIDMILSEAGEISCIVLAGYLSIISENFVKKWNRKIINVLPSPPRCHTPTVASISATWPACMYRLTSTFAT